MKSSVARLRSDNARLQKHCDDRALELKSRRSRTCEMGKKLQDTEVGQSLHTHLAHIGFPSHMSCAFLDRPRTSH